MPRLIDADALLKRLSLWLDEYGFIIFESVKDDINDAPTVDAEPVRHGQWVENNGRYGWYCSQCKKENNYAYDYNENNVIELQDHYCPNCGARMDESTMGQVKPSDKEFTLYADDKPIVTFKASQIVLHGERKEDAEH